MNIVACVDKNFGIGYLGKLIINNFIDTAYFKRLTLGKVIIMGSKTFESLPVKPLPNRQNIVLSSQNINIDGVTIASNKHNLFDIIKHCDSQDVFVCGGQVVYNLLLDYCQYAFINKVDNQMLADRFLTNLDKSENWNLVSETIQRDIKFCLYQNRRVRVDI